MWTKSTLPTVIETFNDLSILSFSLLFSIVRVLIKRKIEKLDSAWRLVPATFPPACNGGAQVCQEHVEMEVRSQISFRRGRNVFPPCPYGRPHQTRWLSLSVITQLFVFLRGTRFDGGHRFSTGDEARNDCLVTWCFVLHLLWSVLGSLDPVSPPSRFHAKVPFPPVRLFRILSKIRVGEIRRTRMVQYPNGHSFSAGNSIFQIPFTFINYKIYLIK